MIQIQKQIRALEAIIAVETNEKDRQRHKQALNKLRVTLKEKAPFAEGTKN